MVLLKSRNSGPGLSLKMQLRHLYFSFSTYGDFGAHVDHMVIIKVDRYQLLMYALLSLFPVKDAAPERVLLKSNLITCSSLIFRPR